jgi:lipopolysaccharide biosynthesis regulator YciM
MYEVLWLLLPVAAASGWWMAMRSQKKTDAGSRATLAAYGQSLNYLINEQADKATEVLVQTVEVDPDTAELHLALGSLFRRRGEVDRAIRVHQNMIARASLSEDLRDQATLELARDFFKAGLHDRAEQLFCDLLERGRCEEDARRHLIDLYELEKDWRKAIDLAGRLTGTERAAWQSRIAHYHCELGDSALDDSDAEKAGRCAGAALAADPGCARASLLAGAAAQSAGDHRSALAAYQRVEQQAAALLPEVLDDIRACYRALDDMPGWERYVGDLSARHPRLFAEPATPPVQAEPPPRYRCQVCGFSSRKLFWQCPGCRCWTSLEPIAPVAGL